jgi:hypothetical protein
MDTLKIIEKLAEAARKETTPQSDVSQAVMHEINALQRTESGFLPLEFFAGISAVAASIITVLSISAWHYIVNPLMQIIAPLQEMPLWR